MGKRFPQNAWKLSHNKFLWFKVLFTWSNRCLMARSWLDPCIEILSEFKLWTEPDIFRFRLEEEPERARACALSPTPGQWNDGSEVEFTHTLYELLGLLNAVDKLLFLCEKINVSWNCLTISKKNWLQITVAKTKSNII